jgi:hypothetical protein
MFAQKEIDRFWSKVDKGDPSDPDACWVWTGSTFWDGYGSITVQKRTYMAHRFSYSLATGKELPSHVLILHSCDNPACVNPRHLSEGTRSKNMQDMLARGRWRPGKSVKKLDCERAAQMRRDHESGEGKKALARKYNVVPKTVRTVLKGETWTSC